MFSASEEQAIVEISGVTRFGQMLKNFFELTKPRALIMIVYTSVFCYLIAATTTISVVHLLMTAFGIAVAGAGSLALNQHMERDLDALMVRTRRRPIPAGLISPRAALVFAWALQIAGYAFLWLAVNPACSIATMICGFSYNFLYTPFKRINSYSSFVGAIPGAMLPIMGWVAVRNQLEIGAWILFVVLFLWQIPHALIISIRHHRDYERAGMKQLPIAATPAMSRRQILLNVLALIPVTLLPYAVNMTSDWYPPIALLSGFVLYLVSARYFSNPTKTRERIVFISLTAYLPTLLLALYLCKPS